ncbi:hypothetical protein L873DRAFT_1845501 [Choiromyces venosus 120613-1]|uniref:Uncharacterized protein n=1 Tax=Choiromyces venosus 120613-1 TaxID=1336337 RepID=A0A3N4JQN1_9PEZI|nr:hypothetical protein L873DRAFT_1845501 [Choiromyces venosus 120613-1]
MKCLTANQLLQPTQNYRVSSSFIALQTPLPAFATPLKPFRLSSPYTIALDSLTQQKPTIPSYIAPWWMNSQAMAKELDPHHLVALMNFEFHGKQGRASRHLDPTSHCLKYGISDDHDTNVRTFPVLDAIASISVSQGKSQVVAVALQLNSEKHKINLTIAQNREVREGLVNYLTDIWAKLKDLSDEYARHRARGSKEYQGRSPEMPEDVGLPFRIEIFRDIYLYSLKKQRSRIEKWWDNLCLFWMDVRERRGGTNLQGIEVNLYNAIAGLSLTLKLIDGLHENPQNQLTYQEWETIYSNSIWVLKNIRLVLAERGGSSCENLALELKDYHPKGPFELRRALEKLISLDRHIDALFAFAHSPHLRSALQYDLSISVVPEQTRTVRLPTSQQQWQSILEAICIQCYDWQGKDARHLLKKFPPKEHKCPVHCECGLIQYLHTKQNTVWGDVPPFRYIGVSKLSCSACRTWIEAFNELEGRQFYTRGSHGKWYWPWGMPMVEESLGKIMVGKISDEYIAHQLELGNLKLSSDSSNASSPEGAHTDLSAAQEELVTGNIANAELEYGSSSFDLIGEFVLVDYCAGGTS